MLTDQKETTTRKLFDFLLLNTGCIYTTYFSTILMLSIILLAHYENFRASNHQVKIISYTCCFYEIKMLQTFIPCYFLNITSTQNYGSTLRIHNMKSNVHPIKMENRICKYFYAYVCILRQRHA